MLVNKFLTIFNIILVVTADLAPETEPTISSRDTNDQIYSHKPDVITSSSRLLPRSKSDQIYSHRLPLPSLPILSRRSPKGRDSHQPVTIRAPAGNGSGIRRGRFRITERPATPHPPNQSHNQAEPNNHRARSPDHRGSSGRAQANSDQAGRSPSRSPSPGPAGRNQSNGGSAAGESRSSSATSSGSSSRDFLRITRHERGPRSPFDQPIGGPGGDFANWQHAARANGHLLDGEKGK